MSKLTHFDSKGQAVMVDVGAKDITERTASAEANVLMSHETLGMILEGRHKKGDVLAVARIAGIMAAKNTSNLIPLCHPLALTSVTLDLNCHPKNNTVQIISTCKLMGQTGVEMEAIMGVNAALITIYDLSKIVNPDLLIQDIRLLVKQGGKSGLWINPNGVPEFLSHLK